ncbi:transposase [Sphingobium sp. AP49]|uniref:transposase n=1 Tax=Sphingobium sp. AP49 TaxID=1144307 RepID=UPI00026EC823|nr:transposase [Sphingobium sp. AP49]WHO40824.1 transposase [Sphingobium sp. AP49]
MEGTLKRSDIAQGIQSELGHDPVLSRRMVDSIIEHMVCAIATGEPLKIKNFGAFHSHEQKPRMARNISTMAPVPLPARRVVIFRPSGALRDAVEQAPDQFIETDRPSKVKKSQSLETPTSFLLTNDQWAKMQPLCPHPRAAASNEIDKNRLFIEAVLWIVRTGLSWSQLPSNFGRWKSVYGRYKTWVEADIFMWLFKACSEDPDMQFAMISGHIVDLKHRRNPGLWGRPGSDPKEEAEPKARPKV